MIEKVFASVFGRYQISELQQSEILKFKSFSRLFGDAQFSHARQGSPSIFIVNLPFSRISSNVYIGIWDLCVLKVPSAPLGHLVNTKQRLWEGQQT